MKGVQGGMSVKRILKKMADDSVHYKQDIKKYVCLTQQVFSLCLFLLFVLHIKVLNVFGFVSCEKLHHALGISTLQVLLSFLGYLAFRYFFKYHPKHVLAAAYINIFQTMMILEVQYYFYDEYMSYTIIICILLCTSLTVIGQIRKYAGLLSTMLIIDVVITVIKHYDISYLQEMKLYFLDNLFIFVIGVGINTCISYLKYQEFENTQKITYLSERDSLTGLLNRKALECSVQKKYDSDKLCAMILLDLDNFKALNDTLGHYEGDNCLCMVANKLKKIFQDTDDVCRLGGDEFVIFISNIGDIDYVMQRAKMILEQVPHKYSHESGDICITCSIGVAFLQQDNANLYEMLYKAADSAMYTSKMSGKNKVTIFSNGLSYEPIDKSELNNE